MDNKKIIIYTTPSCSSCRKAKKWFQERNLDYKERNITVSRLKKDDLLNILKSTNNGFDDIFSDRSYALRNLKMDVNDMTTSEALTLIQNNPLLLKRPIIIEEKKGRIQIGYNEEQIELFLRKD